MSGDAAAVTWPAVIRYHEDDELSYCADEEGWLALARHQHVPFNEHDRLIDSRGQVFRLKHGEQGGPVLLPLAERIDLPAFTTLLRAHAVTAGSCCAGKVGCTDIGEGMALIGQMEEE